MVKPGQGLSGFSLSSSSTASLNINASFLSLIPLVFLKSLPAIFSPSFPPPHPPVPSSLLSFDRECYEHGITNQVVSMGLDLFGGGQS